MKKCNGNDDSRQKQGDPQTGLIERDRLEERFQLHDRLTHLLLNLCLETLGAQTGSLLRFDREEQILHLCTATGLPAEITRFARCPLDTSAAGQVVREGNILRLTAGRLPEGIALVRPELTDAILLPLGDGEVRGVLCAGCRQGRLRLPAAERLQSLLRELTALLTDELWCEQPGAAGFSQPEAVTTLRVFNSTRDFNKLVDLTLSLGLKLLQTDLGLLTVFQDFNRGYDTFAARGLVEEVLDQLVVNLKRSSGDSFFHRERGTLVENIGELGSDHPYHFLARIPQFKSVIVIPLLYGYRIIGRLHLFNPGEPALTEANMRRIMQMTTEAAIALAQALEIRQNTRRAHYDDLTGLMSRNTWLQRVELEITRSQRLNSCLAVIMLDLDFFKVYNDTYGHQTGDQVLQMLPALLQESLRDIDSAGRYGGDEFVLLLPDTDLNGAILVANRIRQGVKQLELGGSHAPLSLSLGMVVQCPGEYKARDLVRMADQALLQAKRRGPGQIVAQTPPGEFIDCTGVEASPAESSDLESRQVEELNPATTERGFCIFIIDSQSNQRDVLEDVFRNWGYEVTAYGSGEEALQALQKRNCDLALTNLHLPGIKGLDFVRRIKAVDLTIPVIVLTNYGSIQTAVEAIRLGADDYIVHPFAMTDIRQSVDKALNRRLRFFEDEMADHYIEPQQRASLRDILHRTGAELTWDAQQLQILEEFNRRSLQQVSSALLLLDESGRVLHVNGRARELLGAPPDLMHGPGLFEGFPQLRDTPLHQGFQICVRTGQPFELNDLWLEPGGNAPRTLVSLQISPFPAERPDACRFLVQLEDVFDRQILAESRDRALRRMGLNLEQRLQPILSEINTALQAEASPDLSDLVSSRLQEIRAILRQLYSGGTGSPSSVSSSPATNETRAEEQSRDN